MPSDGAIVTIDVVCSERYSSN